MARTSSWVILAAAVLPASAGALLLSACAPRPPEFDLVLAGGAVVDGTGAKLVRADVGVLDGMVAETGDLSGRTAAERLDVTGLVVAPGFIDPHVHARGLIREIPTADNFVRQGVTTVVDGHDGSSPLPLGPFLDSVAAVGTAPNFALFVGHGSVREAVMGTEDRAPTAEEVERMKALVADAMAQGALGLSTGLFYVPGSFAAPEEIIELAKVAAASGGLYSTHMRNEDDRVVESVAEAIRVGREAGIAVQISHHKVGGKRNYGRSAETLELIREANAEGVDVSFDQYPYTASHTSLASIVPAWARAGDALPERLADAAASARIRSEMKAFVSLRFDDDPSKIQLSRCGFDPALAGRTLADVLGERGTSSTPDAIADLILELVSRGGCGAIFHSFDEGDVERLLKSEFGMIGSDGGLVRFGEESPHPRSYGTFPRVLGRYVRDRRVLPLEEAVRRMTSAPAHRLGLTDRGRIAVGAVADLVVFDPGTIIDRATFEDPHQYPVGIRYVFVGGAAVVRGGGVTGERPGQVIRGPGWKAASR